VDLHQAGPYRARAAALLRAAANDLKRDDATAETDLGVPPGTFGELVSGRRAVDWNLVRAACEVWPLNERDLLPIHDDCPDGVRIHRLAESVDSSRILSRGGRPYYEYRDTAMSRIASYRPEWIRMLCRVDDDDPDNPAVQWNKGHLLYQFTYFVGPVNYYYEWEGKRFCAEFDTGDSVWGLPFAPHSFAVRGEGETGYILAMTYGGSLVGDPQRELSVLGPETARAMALPASSPRLGRAALIRSFMSARVMAQAELARSSGVPGERLTRIVSGDLDAGHDDVAALAAALEVSVRDLSPPTSLTTDGVRVRRRADAATWSYPDSDGAYRVTRLATDPTHPDTSALELHVNATDTDEWLTTHQHQYLYVLGVDPVRLSWKHRGRRHDVDLRPGDSCYVLPGTPMSLRGGPSASPSVLLLRIAGHVDVDVRFALGSMTDAGVDRYVHEDRMWYDAQGARA
jgi:hypothetical protein